MQTNTQNKQIRITNILENILLANKPSKTETSEVWAIVNEFISKVKKRRKDLGIKVEIMLGGSVAKGTFLKDRFDSDVFFRFSRSYADDKLSDMLEKILQPFRRNNLTRIHGSRDYFQLEYKSVDFELVPVYKITDPSKAVNVTDASPLHVNWVKSQLIEKPDIRDDIILAKMFCKAQGIYGAESYIKGFSGHVLDVLVIHFGGFIKFLENVSKWKANVKIDVMGHGVVLNQAKTCSPVILIDPVQPERNAAAALSIEKYNRFKEAARGFLKAPSEEWFAKKKLSMDDLEDKAGNNNLIIIKVWPQEGKNDIIGCKIMKSFDLIKKRFILNDFDVLESGWNWPLKKDALFWFIIKNEKLDRYKNWIGPPLSATEHVSAFKRMHSSTFEEKGRICARIVRKFLKPEVLAEFVIKDDCVKQKVKRIKLKSVKLK
ncbi:MAG: CCA tRNA nucleotidyltransferase [Nanoarchaeota archaeon]|nr:CCA tRNA nucleotidyltransferase [Nanoarchaeota archaeon]